jgi:hypothetical protein
VADHKEIPGMEGRTMAVTVNAVIGNKGAKFKIIGIYAPTTARQGEEEKNAVQEAFWDDLRRWIDE